MGVRGKTLLAAARSNPASFNEHEIYLALYDDNFRATLYENWTIFSGV
jgi:hypothetical protein